MLKRLNQNIKTVPFGTLIESISGGATPLRAKEEQYCDSGIKFLRIQNIKETGFDFSDVKYITEEVHENLLKRSQLSCNDLLMTITGRIGTCAVVDSTCLPANINQHIVRIRLVEGIDSNFAAAYLNSKLGNLLSNRGVTGTTRIALDYESIKKIPFPIIDNPKQIELVENLEEQFAKINEKIKKADNLIAISKKQLFEGLGIDLPPFVPTIFSCAKSKELLSMGWYCNSHSFYLDDVFRRIKESSYYAGTLEDYAYINPSINKSSLTDSTPVSFVPMNAVSEKTNSATYELTEYSNVKTGFTPFQKNDLLWAKITPCMQNGKSFFADNLPTQYGFASTEFHVIRAKRDDIYMPFLWCILSNDSILEAAQGMFSGSAGQQRVSETFLKKLPIALPSIEVQKELADNVMNALKKSKKLRNEAEQDWIAAKARFEKDLLGE